MSYTLYLDCFSGVSGDMLLGAMIHAGLPLEEFGAQLERLGIASEYRISATKVQRGVFEATLFGIEAFVVDETNYIRKTQKVRSTLSSVPELAYREIVSGPKGITRTIEKAPAGPARKDGADILSGEPVTEDRRTKRIVKRPLPQHRSFAEIRKVIAISELSATVKDRAIGIFEQLADAEAKVHGTIPEMVIFHELGALESLVEVVGVALGLELLGISRIVCSPLPMTRGKIETPSGVQPIPAPAVSALLEGVPVVGDERGIELVTPMGAALVCALVDEFGQMPPMHVVSTGLGAGEAQGPGLPNMLRITMGVESREPHGDMFVNELVELSACIEDASAPEVAFALSKLHSLGATEAFSAPISLARGRQGILVECTVGPDLEEDITRILLLDAGAVSIRRRSVKRSQLPRELKTFPSSLGDCRVYVTRQGGKALTVSADVEDCARIARLKDIGLRDVLRAINAEANAKFLGDRV